MCLSVRCAFDALLTARAFPKGCHVIMSGEFPHIPNAPHTHTPHPHAPHTMCAAINIADMVNIVHAHGLVPVPIDLDFDTLSPDLEFQAAVEDERSVCAVIAHVFGCVVDMAPYARACSRRPWFLLVEDAAEDFCPELMQAPLLSSVRLYSFGPIKVCISWIGAVTVVQDDELRAALLRQLSTYPLQSRWPHLLRVLKFLVLVLLQHPKVFYCLVRVLKAVGLNHAAVLQPLFKSFSAKQSLLDNIRKQPCQAQRISTLINDMLKQSCTRAQCVGPQLPASCRVPGSKAPL